MQTTVKCLTTPYRCLQFDLHMDTSTATLSCPDAGVQWHMPIAQFMRQTQWLISIGWTQRCTTCINDRQMDFSMDKGVARDIIGWADACAVRQTPGTFEGLVQRHRRVNRLGTFLSIGGVVIVCLSFVVWQYASPRWNFIDYLMFKTKLSVLLFGPLAVGLLSLGHAKSLNRRLQWLQQCGEQSGGGAGIPSPHR